MRALRFVALILSILVGTSASFAAELVMFRRDGCSWCQAWDREIGPIYAKTPTGRRAPLRMVDLDGRRPTQGMTLVSPIRFTPTFVLMAENREIARIEGYPGEDFFWDMVQQIILRLPSPTQGGLSSSPPLSTEPSQ